jgi:sugar fermentation stimulation protein A
MQFTEPLLEGKLIKRYKRFLADIELADARVITAYTPNTGSMKGCCETGFKVWLSKSQNTHRKYPYTWELVETAPGNLVGINTGLSNKLVIEGIKNCRISELQGYKQIKTEVTYGRENSRIDILLSSGEKHCYVEVKNVTMVENTTAYFPDAISARGSKHLRELTEMVRQGHRAVLLFCIQRNDAVCLQTADFIDAVYGKTFRLARAAGVEAYAYTATVSISGIELTRSIPVII